jgi:short-subunit dehydrogenase
MVRQIAGKVIIVTGASSGIGKATALALAREGAQLLVVARRKHRLEEIAGAVPLALDLSRREEVETMIRVARQRFGRIDVLINNAGFGFFGTVENTPPHVIREIFDLNFEAPLLASQLAIPIMKEQGGGHIINISSVAGRRGLPLSGIYCATKFALHGLSEALRIELKESKIDVSIVSPAATQSEFPDHIRHGDVTERFKPMGRVQTAEKVAEDIVRCIRRPRPEVYPYGMSRLLVWVNAIAPSLVDRLMIPYFRDRMRAANNA